MKFLARAVAPGARRWPGLAAAWLAGCGVAWAETSLSIPTEAGSGITIKASSPSLAVPRFGFLPLRVSIENLTTHDGTWQVHCEAGLAGNFPGALDSVFEISVPAAQTRETWLYVPTAEPGIAVTTGSLTPPASSGASVMSAPTIPGVNPSPAGVTSSIRSTVGTMGAGLRPARIFTITQTGPANLLPQMYTGAGALPPDASQTVTPPDTAGQVLRVTTIPVALTGPAAGSSGSSVSTLRANNPYLAAMTNAREALNRAGLMPPAGQGVSNRSSGRSVAGATPGTTDYTVTMTQTGPASALPAVDPKKLPAGFTNVTVDPPDATGMTVRTFTYVETMAGGPAMPVQLSGNPSLGGPAGGMMDVTTARTLLAPTGLLTTPAGVTTKSQLVYGAPLRSGSGALSGSSSVRVAVFIQTGPASALNPVKLPKVPDNVRVTILPGPPGGDWTRTITVIDASVLPAIAVPLPSGGMGTSMAIDRARLELQRSGFLVHPGAGVSESSQIRGTGPGSTIILSESGPANLLPQPPVSALPYGVTCTITPGAIAGEMSRNFIVDVKLLSSYSGAPGGTGAAPATTGHANPQLAGTQTALTIEVMGPGVGALARTGFPNSSTAGGMVPFAVSPALDQALRVKLPTAAARGQLNLSAVEAAQLPADWRVWSSFNTVLLKSSEYSALDAAHRGALRDWVALGGVLLLSPDLTAAGASERLGAGRIETLADPVADMEPGEIYNRLKFEQPAPGMPERDKIHFMPGTPMGDLLKYQAGDTTWVILFLCAFAVVIGPVNLYYFAPAKRRSRLFLTTPLISLGGAALVALAIVLQDGLGGVGVRRALVVLVPGENQAAVFQEQVSHTGFLPGRGFTLEAATLCASLPPDPSGNMLFVAGTHMLRAESSARGDWFANRSRQAQMLRTIVPTRGRIERMDTAGDGAPVVESTLGADLHDFRLRDDRGRLWAAAEVKTGQRTTLQPVPAGTEAKLGFEADASTHLNTLLRDVAAIGGAWQWCGHSGKGDLAPIPTLSSVRWNDDAVLYTGVAVAANAIAQGLTP